MNILGAFKEIRAFVLDVDGVLTDGSLLLLDDGQMVRKMNIRDGYALQLAVKKGYRVAIISGGVSEAVETRLQRLGINEIFMSVKDKRSKFIEFATAHGYKNEEVLFMGDDIPDLEAMQLAGLPCCPSDAAPEIVAVSRYISPFPGGSGCVRDVIEKTMKLNNHWLPDPEVSSR